MNSAQILRNQLANNGLETTPNQCQDFIDVYESTSYETYEELKDLDLEDLEELAAASDCSVAEAKKLVEFTLYLCESKFKNLQD